MDVDATSARCKYYLATALECLTALGETIPLLIFIYNFHILLMHTSIKNLS